MSQIPFVRCITLACLMAYGSVHAEVVPIRFLGISSERSIGRCTEILVDRESTLTAQQAWKAEGYRPGTADVPNLGLTDHTFWVRFSVTNLGPDQRIILHVPSPEMEDLDLFAIRANGPEPVCRTGQSSAVGQRPFPDGEYAMPLDIRQRATTTYLLRVHSHKQALLPLQLTTQEEYLRNKDLRGLIAGGLFGIFIVMALYNLFVFFSIRDTSYLIYVIYILLVCVTQINFLGYTQLYLWPSSTAFAVKASQILTVLTAVSASLFMHRFTRSQNYIPHLRRFTPVFYVLLAGGLAMGYLGRPLLGYKILQVSVAAFSLYLLLSALLVWIHGFRPAGFFCIAWSLFLIGITMYVMKDVGLLPYTWATKYMMPVGSVAEVVLLSFGLADKINVLRRDKERSQLEALRMSQENERIIRDQNVLLERKVVERTQALQESNDHLKRTQSQLVSAEKMASLGQLTAGIAHEINNPVNFISSNIPPLKRDLIELRDILLKYREAAAGTIPMQEVQDMERAIDVDENVREVQNILKSMEEGAARTSAIVRGLRTFSRLDEDDLKPADINEGLRSTLVLLGSQLRGQVKVELELGQLPRVECYPGKLNQVFMNMINNAAHAAKEQHGDNGGTVTVTSAMDDDTVTITIRDNGVGMDEATLRRVFEPFFTTKDVGEGTGLGLSIAHSIIEKHGGRIEVDSAPGQGTEFRILLPVDLQQRSAKRA
ncbi:MAG: 7TM diverse intracellular signaling domain-containing protein [Flavobacteriales bacterium]